MKAIRYVGSAAFVVGLFVLIFGGLPWHVMTARDPAVPWWLRITVFAFLGGVLAVLLTVAVEQRRSAPQAAPPPAEPEGEGEAGGELLLLNTDAVPGRRIAGSLGLVQGHTVFAIWLGKDLSALIRLILGGELTEYTDMMGRARADATDRMTAEAVALGADAIINVRYMTTSVIGSAAELLVYGTAVTLGPRTDAPAAVVT